MERILQVVTHMNRGGLETMLMNYYRNIDRNHIQFDFLVHRTERADYDDEIECLGGKIHRLPMLNPLSKNYKKELNTFFKEHPEYNVVHVHQDCMSSVILKVAKRNNVPVCIAHSHCASQDKNLKYILKMYFRKKIPVYADYLFACGNDAGNWMFRGEKFLVLNNAINAKEYQYNFNVREDMRQQLGIGENTLLIGHVGRFNYPKNHMFLLEVFKELSRFYDAKLLLVGDGLLRDKIEDKVRCERLEDKVILTGVRKDIANLLQAMDIFVFPSHYEGLPVTVIEAQAAGLPCLISDKVSLECKKTDLVTQVPLEAGVDIWVSAIIKEMNTKRKDTYREIKEAGYDIQENANKLQKFYLNVAKGEENICLY